MLLRLSMGQTRPTPPHFFWPAGMCIDKCSFSFRGLHGPQLHVPQYNSICLLPHDGIHPLDRNLSISVEAICYNSFMVEGWI